MWETSARLLRLLSLLQTRRDWSGAELAERLDITPRTARRDIDRLRGLGYPVLATAGAAGYRLGAGADLPPLLLDDLAARVAGSMLRSRGGRAAGISITERESEVLRLMALGHSNKDIAAALNLSVKTVEVHKANGMRKLGLGGRTDVVRYALLQGWLSDP